MSKNRGGLLELVSRGKKDVFLLSNPKVSFFHSAYIRAAPFSEEVHVITPRNQPEWGKWCEFDYEHRGDLVRKTYLRIRLPTWLPDSLAAINRRVLVTDAENVAYGYCNNVGFHVIDRIQFFNDQVMLQELYGEALDWRLRQTNSLATTLVIASTVGTRGESKADIGRAATPGLLRVPIPLLGWEAVGDPGFPTCALRSQRFRVRVLLRRLEEVVVSSAVSDRVAQTTGPVVLMPVANESLTTTITRGLGADIVGNWVTFVNAVDAGARFDAKITAYDGATGSVTVAKIMHIVGTFQSTLSVIYNVTIHLPWTPPAPWGKSLRVLNAAGQVDASYTALPRSLMNRGIEMGLETTQVYLPPDVTEWLRVQPWRIPFQNFQREEFHIQDNQINAASKGAAGAYALTFGPLDFVGPAGRLLVAFQRSGARLAGERTALVEDVATSLRFNVAAYDRVQPFGPRVFQDVTAYWKNVRGAQDLADLDKPQPVYTITFGGYDDPQPYGTLNFTRAVQSLLAVNFSNTIEIDWRTKTRDLFLIVYALTWRIWDIKEGKGKILIDE